MPKLRIPNPNKDLNRTPRVHTNFKVLEVTELGGDNRYRVDWSAMFGGMKVTDYLVLYADDELDAFQLAIKTYGGNGDGR